MEDEFVNHQISYDHLVESITKQTVFRAAPVSASKPRPLTCPACAQESSSTLLYLGDIYI